MPTKCFFATVPRDFLFLVGVLLVASAEGQILQSVSIVDPQLVPGGGSGDSAAPVISPDARFILFASTANNLLATSNHVGMPTLFPPRLNVFLRDRLVGTTTLVSVNAGTKAWLQDLAPAPGSPVLSWRFDEEWNMTRNCSASPLPREMPLPCRVAQSCTLLYRRVALGMPLSNPSTPIRLRHADYKSALPGWRGSPPSVHLLRHTNLLSIGL